MSQYALKFRRTITVAALAITVAAGTFVVAGHVSAAKSPPKNALHEVPAVTGIDTSPALMW